MTFVGRGPLGEETPGYAESTSVFQRSPVKKVAGSALVMTAADRVLPGDRDSPHPGFPYGQASLYVPGRIHHALGTLGVFLVGGLSGIFNGSAPADIYIHDTYFVVAHFHYTLISATFFGGFAGIYYWFPKMVGRMMNETLGTLHFWMTYHVNMHKTLSASPRLHSSRPRSGEA